MADWRQAKIVFVRLRKLSVASFALLFLTADAQTPRPCAVDAPLRLSPSPAEITAADDLAALWKRLGIPAMAALERCEGCTRDLIRTEKLLNQPQPEALIRVCQNFSGENCRILFLQQQNDGQWRLLDHLDFADLRYRPPEAKVVDTGGKRWLVTNYVGGSGTDVALNLEEWLEFRCGRLQQVLVHPLEGHDLTIDPLRYFRTAFDTFEKNEDAERLLFRYQIRFESKQDRKALWAPEHRVVYERKSPDSEFRFSPKGSEITQAQRHQLFSFDSMTEVEFFDYAYPRLLEIASLRSDTRHPWLSSFLVRQPPGPKVERLQKALERTSTKR
jgi:hypothetical protein